MKKGQTIKLLTNVGKLKKNEIVTVTGVDYALRMAFIKNDKGISESVDNNFSNYQLMNDSNERLKSYKIKNHDSGKTYVVKAVSYTDAKMKYNEYILRDSFIEDNSFNALYQFRKELKAISFKSDERVIRSAFLKAETIARQVESSIRGLSAQYKTKLANLKKDPHNKTAETEYLKVSSVVNSIKNTLIDCAQFFKTRGGEITKVLSIWSNGRIVGQRFEGKTDKYLSMAEKYYDRFIQLYQQLDRTLKDSLTEDALSTFVQSYLSTKKVSSKAEQDEIIKFLLERNKITTEDIPKVRKLLKIVKDALTEDADLTGKIAKYNGMTVKVLRKLTEQEKRSGAYAINPNAGDYYEVEATSKVLGKSKFIVWEARLRDSLTEDADIAQTDIKSTYLPEDANADNIQYLGFNEKRKLSFYGYGDRYFVHYDLEGRTEEVDKETVQKILKKNILGEIDENDLINKEPQSEEIVSDAFESDAGEISIEQFDPKRLVESSKSRKQALHNEIKMKNGDVYTVFFQASGEIENPRSIWVSIVLEKSNGQQEKVLTEKANSYEQAIQIMTDWKKKQERGDR